MVGPTETRISVRATVGLEDLHLVEHDGAGFIVHFKPLGAPAAIARPAPSTAVGDRARPARSPSPGALRRMRRYRGQLRSAPAPSPPERAVISSMDLREHVVATTRKRSSRRHGGAIQNCDDPDALAVEAGFRPRPIAQACARPRARRPAGSAAPVADRARSPWIGTAWCPGRKADGAKQENAAMDQRAVELAEIEASAPGRSIRSLAGFCPPPPVRSSASRLATGEPMMPTSAAMQLVLPAASKKRQLRHRRERLVIEQMTDQPPALCSSPPLTTRCVTSASAISRRQTARSEMSSKVLCRTWG